MNSKWSLFVTTVVLMAFVACNSQEKDSSKGSNATDKREVEKTMAQRPKPQNLAEKNLKEGDAFLAQNAAKEGVVTTASGLQYLVLKEAYGPKPAATDRVTVHYRGTLIDGTEFDSSYERGQAATFKLEGVIAGWTEGLQHMSVGSTYRFFIPPTLAYGQRGAGRLIGPNATLIFDVELREIGE